ncbi:1-deoxy-D-xylulose-5-phosphate synthase [Intestinibacillus massiliensis]|nr:1-deoxy-D-xylulose-5-phosphate synthase [Intestinibacillus massiliensis]
MKRYGVLDRINKTADLRELPYSVLYELCGSLREFIIDHVSQTGGHLSSNLGIVELAVALERVFDSNRDRIIYDVGHQCYVHKILTGRKEAFTSLRQYGGLSGFLKPEESQTDPCITGHASSSVSVALGMAHARTLKNQKYHVVAVIGDGALTGGMAYEALNNAGGSGEPLIVVLNDNNMSITQNVGAMSRHLAHLRVSPRYQRAKAKVKGALSHVPGGRTLTNGISRVKSGIKSVVLPTTLFEQMGFAYLGPVDGHDLKAVCEILTRAKAMKQPVLLHVMTRKGKGYRFAEEHPGSFHGVSPFDVLTGKPLKPAGMNFSACFGEALSALASQDERICAVTAAMSSGTGLTGFAEKYPSRFFDVGIAEEHAVAMCAGMAKQGLKPVCALYSTFLQRAYDQIIHDVAIEGIGVVFAIDRAGVVGEDGATHNGVFDVGFLQQIPGVTILCPSNFDELRSMLAQAIYKRGGPVAIRYPRGGEGAFTTDTSSEWAACLTGTDSPDVSIVTYGIMVNQALQAASLLEGQGVHVQVWKINEISEQTRRLPEGWVQSLGGRVLVLEDAVHNGCYGKSIEEALQGTSIEVYLCNLGNRFLAHGSVAQLYKECGIDGESVALRIQEWAACQHMDG